MHHVIITNQSNSASEPIDVLYCNTFLSRFKGLMFKPSLNPSEGILLVEKRESILDTSIHMLFMNFDITVVWLNQVLQVVDVKLARRWKLAYLAGSPAQYVLEIHSSRLGDFRQGDQIAINHG